MIQLPKRNRSLIVVSLAAFVVVALSVEIRERRSSVPDREAYKEPPEAESTSERFAFAGSSRRESAPPSSARPVARAAEQSEESIQRANVLHGRADVAVTAQTGDANTNAEHSDTTPSEPHDAHEATTARPIVVSASIEQQCSDLEEDQICKDLHRVLDQLRRESRDPAWAPKMEAVLRERMLSVEPGKYAIRALECRTSACLVEISSPHGAYSGGPQEYDFGRENGIYMDALSHGYERKPDGSRITVTVMTYIRR